MKMSIVFTTCVVAGSCLAADTWQPGHRTDYLHLSHVHRGGGKAEGPDNTLETLRWCWSHGSAAEVDCRRTRDGVPILLHDRTLKRTARGISQSLATNEVRNLLWDEIKDVDVGSYLGPQYAHHRVPRLEACFKEMQGHPQRVLFIDERDYPAESLVKLARQYGVMDQIYYTTGKYKSVPKWINLVPDGHTLFWIGTWPVPKNHCEADRKRFDDFYEKTMQEVRAANYRGISAVSLHTYYDPKAKDPFIPSTPLLRKVIDEFHAHGIVVCSIPFQGGEMSETYYKLWDLGCDGFSTDYPSIVFEVIRKLKEGQKK